MVKPHGKVKILPQKIRTVVTSAEKEGDCNWELTPERLLGAGDVLFLDLGGSYIDVHLIILC